MLYKLNSILYRKSNNPDLKVNYRSLFFGLYRLMAHKEILCMSLSLQHCAMHISWSEPDLNFPPCVLQITAYNRRSFETARHNLVIHIMGTEGKIL